MEWLRGTWVRWVAVASAAVVVAGVLVLVLWPGEPAPRAREYRDYDVCLLTGQRGLAEAESALAWDGLHEVSARTDVRVSYLAIAGPQTDERADQFLMTLVLQGCGVIVAAEELPAGAVDRARSTGKDVTGTNAIMVTFDNLGDLSRDAALNDVVAEVEPLIPSAS